MPAERSLLEKLCLSSKLEHARLLLLVNCCRIVAKRKSAKQRCRKLACGQRLARPTSWAAEKYSWCGQVVEAAGCCVCAFGAGQECQTDQCTNRWPTARDGQRGELKQEALSLEAVQQEARRALVWLDFALNGHKNGRRLHFWVRCGNLSFPKIIFSDGLVFGAAWRSLFWSRLAASFLYSWRPRLA